MTSKEEERALALVRAFNKAAAERKPGEVKLAFSTLEKCVANFECSITIRTMIDDEGQFFMATLDKM